MRETEAVIERIWRISSDLQRLEVGVEAALTNIQAGQSVLALPEQPGWEPYLREHWIPIETNSSQLIIERPIEAHYVPGQVVSLLGPVGSPLPWMGGKGKHLLLIAQDTSPIPLMLLAQQALAQGAEVALVLLGEATSYPLNALPPALEVMNGNAEGGWTDQENVLQWSDQIFATVRDVFWQDSLNTLFQTVKKIKMKVPVNYIYGVLTPLLPCGTGACTACMVRCKTANKLVCTQGPAFDLTEVLLS